MKTRLFYTTGNEDIIETEWDKPEPTDTQIEVKNVITGVCRSDIDMYTGNFATLPKEIQGHEGLGMVTKIGRRITDVEEGDIVATRGEPAFADYYNAEQDTYVAVPEISPRYIVEPVACGINIFKSSLGAGGITSGDIIILGSGFLATVLYETIRMEGVTHHVTVVGRANTDYWKAQNVELHATRDTLPETRRYNLVYDLSDKTDYLENLIPIHDCATIILAAEKHPNAVLPMQDLLWKAAKIIFPSPRNNGFIDSMEMAVELIRENVIKTEPLWTHVYDRDTEVKKAFKEGLNRTEGYSRGFIRW